MSISVLATELVLALAECLDDSSLNELARSCRALHGLLDPFLYARHAKLGFLKPLRWALMTVSPGTVRRLLDDGMDVETILIANNLPQSSRPLYLAATQWHNVTALSLRLQLPVIHIVHVEDDVHMSMIRLLLERGARMTLRDARDLLSIASNRGLPELAQLTLRHGSSLDIAASSFVPQIMKMATLGDLEVLEILLEQGFPIQSPEHYTATPLYIAIDHGRLHAARLLLERGAGADRTQDSQECSPLHYVVSQRQVVGPDCLELVRMLVYHGADVNSPCPAHGLPNLYEALERNDDAVTHFLVKSGADIHWRDPFPASYDGPTYLHKAVSSGSRLPPRAILKLAELGFDLEAQDNEGKTALHYAVLGVDLDRLDMLLQLPVDMEARTEAGWTAMHLAVTRWVAPRLVKALVKAGAEVNAQTTVEGLTALHIAISCRDSSGFVEMLLEAGADIHARACDGSTALHVAVSHWSTFSLVETLVNAGVDINAQRTSDGSTALHIATNLKRENIVHGLLLLGADVGIQDHSGKTALDIFNGFPDPSPDLATLKKLLLQRWDGESTTLHNEVAEGETTTRVTRAARRKALTDVGPSKAGGVTSKRTRSMKTEKTGDAAVGTSPAIQMSHPESDDE